MLASLKCVTTPAGVIRPIELLYSLVNHRFPSGPAVTPNGWEMVASLKCVTTPAGVIRPIVLFPALVNHRFPSGPAAIPFGSEMSATARFVTAPSGSAAVAAGAAAPTSNDTATTTRAPNTAGTVPVRDPRQHPAPVTARDSTPPTTRIRPNKTISSRTRFIIELHMVATTPRAQTSRCAPTNIGRTGFGGHLSAGAIARPRLRRCGGSAHPPRTARR